MIRLSFVAASVLVLAATSPGLALPKVRASNGFECGEMDLHAVFISKHSDVQVASKELARFGPVQYSVEAGENYVHGDDLTDLAGLIKYLRSIEGKPYKDGVAPDSAFIFAVSLPNNPWVSAGSKPPIRDFSIGEILKPGDKCE